MNHVPDQQFSLKQWVAVGDRSCKLRETGSAYCYLRFFEKNVLRFSVYRDAERADKEASYYMNPWFLRQLLSLNNSLS